MIKHLLFLLFFSLSLYGQFSTSKDSLAFDFVEIGTVDSTALFIINNSGGELIIIRESNTNTVFSTPAASYTIPFMDSIEVYIIYKPTTNVIDNGSMVFRTPDSVYNHAVTLTGKGFMNEPYHISTFNLYDIELKNAIKNYVSNHISLGYNLARDRMFDTIDKLPGDTIECVYTGIKIKAENRTQAQNQGFNTEHTWPQSLFSQNEPMRSDLYHLYPTNDNANNIRANYPFAFVNSGVTWQQGGSKLGRDIDNLIVFEPRDVHKGNVARSMFYFVLRYTNYSNFLSYKHEKDLRNWTLIDPVDSIEKRRNNFIKTYQGKANPLIEHPSFLDRIYLISSDSSRPRKPEMSAFPTVLKFDTVFANSNSNRVLVISNIGNAVLKIDSVRMYGTNFNIINPIQIVQPLFSSNITVSANPTLHGEITDSMTIYSNDGIKTIVLKAYSGVFTSVQNTVIEKDEVILHQNYPNPFNSSTSISFSLITRMNVEINIYNALGKLVKVLMEKELNPGLYNIYFDADEFPSGVYFYQLRTESYFITKRMLLLK